MVGVGHLGLTAVSHETVDKVGVGGWRSLATTHLVVLVRLLVLIWKVLYVQGRCLAFRSDISDRCSALLVYEVLSLRLLTYFLVDVSCERLS